MEQVTVKQMLNRVSERIRACRKSLGLTQEQLAEYSDLSPNYIARIELGTKTPSVSTLFKIARALNANPADLVSEEPPAEPSYADQVAHALSGLDEAEAKFAVDQLRAAADFLKRHCSNTIA
jgi:transcriptional regulator with XRE-family HTH domain